MNEILPYVLSGGLALISGLCAICAKILWRLADNIAELNQKMAVIVSEMAHGNKRIERIDEDMHDFRERMTAIERAASTH